MKRIFLTLSLIFSIYSLSAQTVVSDSVTMGPGYGNDVYYSLKNGQVSVQPNNNWHIAFRNGLQTDAIFINTTAAVKAYLTNADTTAWLTLDSSNATTEVHNTDTSWEIGAFNRTFDNPYSSWGVYNTLTHKVTGDSLFLLKIGATWKKLWIVEKDFGVWKIRMANTNNTQDTTFTISSADYKNRLFVYVNANSYARLNAEPADSAWDFKFTRYAALQPDQGVYYPSTGVLNNKGVSAVKVNMVVKESYNNHSAHSFSNSISAIGADWKSFDNANFRWAVADSTVYFVRVKNGDIYKMYFTGFTGQSTGKSYFNIEKLFTTGIRSVNNPVSSLTVYPNPASAETNLLIDLKQPVKDLQVKLVGINGQIISEDNYNNLNGFNNIKLNTNGLQTGIYFVFVTANGTTTTQKLVIAN